MVRTTDADEHAEHMNDLIAKAIDAVDADAEFNDPAVMGTGADAWVTTTVTFDPHATARDVARVRRKLPISFDKEISFNGGDTLTLRVEWGRSD